MNGNPFKCHPFCAGRAANYHGTFNQITQNDDNRLRLHVERCAVVVFQELLYYPTRCPGRLPGEVFRARPTGRRPRGRPRTRQRDNVSRLAWERLGVPPEELEEVAGDRDVWVSLLKLLPPRPDPPEKRQIMDRWMDTLLPFDYIFLLIYGNQNVNK